MFTLGKKFGVYVPSTTDTSVKESEQVIKERMAKVLEKLSKEFGGASAQPIIGGWVDNNGNLVQEDIYFVYSFVTQENENRAKTLLIEIAKGMKEDYSQEAILLEFSGEAFLI